jgi:hypothetical protein
MSADIRRVSHRFLHELGFLGWKLDSKKRGLPESIVKFRL